MESKKGGNKLVKFIEVECGIGDTVYCVRDGEVLKMKVEFIYINKDGSIRYHARNNDERFNFRGKGIGRDVFFTLTDALESKWRIKHD